MKILKENSIIKGLVGGGLLFIIAFINLEMNGGERYSDMTWWGQIPALILMIGIPAIVLYVIGKSIISKFKKK